MPVVDSSDAIQGSLWWALRGTHRLAGTAQPDTNFDWHLASGHGLTHVISLTGTAPANCEPLVASTHELQDLYGAIDPSDPTRERQRVATAATTVRALLDAGEGVLVHCLGGTGRTGTVIGAVLVSYGHELDDVAAWLNAVHTQRGQSWPESGWQQTALDALH